MNKMVTELDMGDNDIGHVGAQAPRSSGSPEKKLGGEGDGAVSSRLT